MFLISWIKRSNLFDTDSADDDDSDSDETSTTNSIRMFTDEKLEWMRLYGSIVDEERWSLSVLIFDSNGILTYIQRQVDPSRVASIIESQIQGKI